jgi:integrin beta 3
MPPNHRSFNNLPQLDNFHIQTIISVDFHDGIQVWWDGATRAYIDAPASYRGKTKGLCGTFNSNMQDDFLTPEGTLS